MANIIANPEWKDVRVLEREEVALGGVGGNMNEQATSLVARTELLLQEKANKSELEAVAGGHKGYTTLTLAQADQANLPMNSIVEITNDGANNGTYQWNGTTLTKSAYDPLTQAKNYTDAKSLANRNYIAGLLDEYRAAAFTIKSEGRIVDTSGTGIFINYSGGQYIEVTLSGSCTHLKITGARTDISSWKWMFLNADGLRISVSSEYGNAEIPIPLGSVKAIRTYKSSATENPEMVVEEGNQLNRFEVIEKDIADIQSNLNSSDTETIDYSVVSGAIINTSGSGSTITIPGAGRAYIRADVSAYSQFSVTNSIDFEWKWVFADKDLVKLSTTSNFGNSTFDVPENAKWAFRSHRLDSLSLLENPNMLMTGTKKDLSLQSQINKIDDEVSYISNTLLNVLADTTEERIAIMQKFFDEGKVLKISDFVGATQHDQIEASIKFIKKRGWGILDMESGVWLRNSAVLLPDNCWIYLNEATVKLADGVFDNVFRNDGIVPNPDPFEYALELRENKNIRIFGKSIALAKVSGPDVPYTAPHPINGGNPVPWVGDWYGWRTVPILLANVKDYKLHDFGMVKTTCWAVSQEHGCENFEVYNIGFNTTVKNGDGVDVRQGCKNGKIYNITGYTLDDTVALSAIQNFIAQHPSGNYIYPMQVGGYGDRGFGGDIENVMISNIKSKSNHHGVRLLVSGGSKQKNISIDGVEDVGGAMVSAMVVVSSGYGDYAKLGDLKNITVNGIKSNFSKRPLLIGMSVQDSSFNYIRQARTADGVLYELVGSLVNSEITNAEFVTP